MGVRGGWMFWPDFIYYYVKDLEDITTSEWYALKDAFPDKYRHIVLDDDEEENEGENESG